MGLNSGLYDVIAHVTIGIHGLVILYNTIDDSREVSTETNDSVSELDANCLVER